MYVGWAYNKWETDEGGDLTAAGQARAEFMKNNMPKWVLTAFLK